MSSAESFGVVVADDHELLCDMWAHWFGMRMGLAVLARCCSDGEVREALEAHPDAVQLLVIDQGLCGAECCLVHELCSRWPSLSVVVISGGLEDTSAVHQGARWWFSKNQGPEVLDGAVRVLRAERQRAIGG